ncbi:MAG: pirin family protein [Candidatus Heimdallarchaeota archaeon]
MTKIRTVKEFWKSKPTMEGAGVKLRRAFGHYETAKMDPFLLLDDFHSNNPDDYLAGFPWHPHRGIETITYVLHGNIEHEDSLGNKGTISDGDVQWMTAGSGIIHQEMPGRTEGKMAGFQLWANLPKDHKMMHPRYQDITQDQIPSVKVDDNIIVKIISGELNKTKGPVEDIMIDPEYFDITMETNSTFEHATHKGYTVFAYIIEGEGFFDEAMKESLSKDNVVLFDDGESLKITTKDTKIRFLLISGKPIKEPIAWRGPIVMNTQFELKVAFEELQKGKFIKHKQ